MEHTYLITIRLQAFYKFFTGVGTSIQKHFFYTENEKALKSHIYFKFQDLITHITVFKFNPLTPNVLYTGQ